MKRIDKIYNYMVKHSQNLTPETLKSSGQFSAIQISKDLNILRNNVSMELNTLLRQNKIIKIKGRPVFYMCKNIVEKVLHLKFPEGLIEINSIEDLMQSYKEDKIIEENDPFNNLIGAKTSLKNQIEQAKAAVLYPPNGLHTLIVGQTGVGKTLFANMMYSYAKYTKRLKEDAPFIVFNCADYYNNSQLLISQIFGHAKGAFTGADSDKQGLVEKANGGILFLDEIHRLPPEGQEMIFYFIDTGMYNRLGETDKKRSSKVLIIGATTEEPSSSFLKTFLRRIPITITIPSLAERTAKDKVDMMKFLFSNEAHRVNKPIKVEESAAKAIIGSATFGNIGQMKSNIQLVCAKGFLNSINNSGEIEIDFKSLSNNIKKGLFYLGENRKNMEEISKYIDSSITIMPEGHKILTQEDPYEPDFNLYKIIEDKASILKEQGADNKFIKKFISADINIHLKTFYDRFKNEIHNKEKLLEIVTKDILEFTEEVKKIVEKKLNETLSDRFLYAFSLHLSAFLKRAGTNMYSKYPNIEKVVKDNPKEYEVALVIKDLIVKKYKVNVPRVEIMYLTLLLSSMHEEKNNKSIPIIVIAHGTSTATSMVNVTKRLLGDCSLAAIDMPLEVSPMKILDETIKKSKELDNGKGILLLVDMGSLANFDTVISEKTGIKVKTLDMVSTPMVLEAVRKSSIFDIDLNTLYESLKGFKGYARPINQNTINTKPMTIITICSTGQGTAKKLKEIVRNIISNSTKSEIMILPISIPDLKKIENLKKTYNILMAVGIKNPKSGIPFISIESLISGSGEQQIIDIIKNNTSVIHEKKQNIVVKDLCKDTLEQFLTYLNPSKVINVLINFIDTVEKNLGKNFSNSTKISLIVHVGCALERMIVNDGLIYRKDKSLLDQHVLNVLRSASSMFKVSINVSLTEDELCFIAETLY